MDEKFAKYEKSGKPVHATMRPYPRPARRFRPMLIMTLVALCFYYYLRPLTPFGILPQVVTFAPPQASRAQKAMATTSKALVPLEAHIMSKCPDARDCLRMLVLPTMQRVIDKVNFTLSYIGTPTENDGVDCKHGPEECTSALLGDSLESRWLTADCVEQASETSCYSAPLLFTLIRRCTSDSPCV